MTEISQYMPSSRTPDSDDTTTWQECQDNDYLATHDRVPECSAHHTYVETIPVDRFGVWACPSCGRFSDTYEKHSGGTCITSPTGFGDESAIVIIGQAYVPPSDDRGGSYGDETMRGLLLKSHYSAKGDIKAFKSEMAENEWHPRGNQPQHYRRWVPEWKMWAVTSACRSEFIDHMGERGFIVIDLPRLSDYDDRDD